LSELDGVESLGLNRLFFLGDALAHADETVYEREDYCACVNKLSTKEMGRLLTCRTHANKTRQSMQQQSLAAASRSIQKKGYSPVSSRDSTDGCSSRTKIKAWVSQLNRTKRGCFPKGFDDTYKRDDVVEPQEDEC
jgi:hypothetical protein